MKKQRLIFSLLLATSRSRHHVLGNGLNLRETEDGAFYINFSDIREADGFVYWWQLNDLIEPNKGTLSAITYHQTVCFWFRTKYLRGKVFKANMAGGTAEREYDYENPKWIYPAGHLQGQLVQDVCGYVASN